MHGPPGIGKSSLVRQFEAICREHGADALRVDARDLPPGLDGLTAALAPLVEPARPPRRRTVLLIDTYELLAPLDAAFREQLAPLLPADVVLVLAGQQPPGLNWRTDPGWAPLLHPMPLAGLSAADCGRYLAGRGLSAEHVQRVVDFTHGHPLALALVAEVAAHRGQFDPGRSADVVQTLIDRLLCVVPSPRHRSALEAAAQVRVINEPLLAALLQAEDVAAEFGWLRGLPFVDAGRAGLYLHELTRDVLAADLRWRDPSRYAAYHDRARSHYLGQLDAADPQRQAAALLDLIYLHPDLRHFLQPPEDTVALRVAPLTAGQRAPAAELVGRHEGAASAELARHWLAERPDAWLGVQDENGTLLGVVCLLSLAAPRPVADPRELVDPAVVAARRELATRPPLRPGETATLIRFWLSRDHYQSVSPVQSLIATEFARHFLTTAGLAVTLLPFARPEEWVAFCAYADQQPAPLADFTVAGRTYTTFAHDWRAVPPPVWLARMSLRELGVEQPANPPAPEALVLTEAEFAAAVRQALRDYTRPDRLRGNPLLRCRVVAARTRSTGAGRDAGEAVSVLQGVLKEAVDSLGGAPADRRLQRVLVRAYLSPAPTLERAAEVLELPSSTFRRLLGLAVGRVAARLWHQELEG